MVVFKVAHIEAEGLDASDLELVQQLIVDEQAGSVEFESSDDTDQWWLSIEYNADSASLLVAADIITEDDLWNLYDSGVESVQLYV